MQLFLCLAVVYSSSGKNTQNKDMMAPASQVRAGPIMLTYIKVKFLQN